MTTTPAVLIEGTFAAATATASVGAYYLSDQCTTAVDKLTCTNEGAVTATATAQLFAPDGTSVQTFTKALDVGASWPFPDIVGHTIASGGKLTVTCPTASTIKVRASGRKFT
jgi:hypothetical protein